MSEVLSELEAVVSALLQRRAMSRQPITPELIRKSVGQGRLMIEVNDDEAEALARKLEERFDVEMTLGPVLTEKGFEPWLEGARANIQPFYWDRYQSLLSSKGLPPQVLATLDQVTDRTLGLLENPAKEGSWDRRGMVVGHVQSGKTSNYLGLVSKAADAGYKVIIIIAGIHNSLRNQTQVRVDEGFVGRDSSKLLSRQSDEFVGVGHIDPSRLPVSFTNTTHDFNKGLASGLGVPLQSVTEPAIFVIKKNPSTLKNLIDWLRGNSAKRLTERVDLPVLIIDDEADNASINISQKSSSVSTINRLIRELLQLFTRSCYVGYTATPFANIFIDPDTDDEMLGQDLFPRHFIVSLDPPSNYFGATRVFLDENERILRDIEDNNDWLPVNHKIETRVDFLPPSLKHAVRTFVIARAIRLVRGQSGEHCSMLVNVSRFTDVQGQVKNEIHAFLATIRANARTHAADDPVVALQNHELAALHSVWSDEFGDLEESWEDVQRHLVQAISPITVLGINNKSADRLDYESYPDGRSVIAVGGMSLSRGLTLEGLMVSYFLRNSMMYDTLMQMGRWFGYRPGYDDLCRVWMPEEAQGWYEHITESIEMLRDDLREMERVGATPEEFGLRVRAHPDTLIVTARNKMKSAEKVTVQVGLSKRLIETHRLRNDSESLDANRQSAIRFVERLAEANLHLDERRRIGRGYLIRDVPADLIISYINEFRNHPQSIFTDPGSVTRHIEDRIPTELARWDVLFSGLQNDESVDYQGAIDHTLGVPIVCQRRSRGEKSNSQTLLLSNKQRVASRGVEKVGLEAWEIKEAERAFKEDPANKGKVDKRTGKANIPDHAYRMKRTRPLLIVHLIKIGEKGADLRSSKPVIAWSISFPPTAMEEKLVQFMVTQLWMSEFFGADEDEEFEDE